LAYLKKFIVTSD